MPSRLAKMIQSNSIHLLSAPMTVHPVRDRLLVRPGVFKPDLDRALRSIPTKGFFNKVPSGKNNVYVGHGVTFTQGVLSNDFGIAEVRIFLEEGEAAIFEPSDKPRVLGKIKFY
jgi:hypothetical protein